MSPNLSEMVLVISNSALCLEPARWVLTNKEKIKDRHDLEGADVDFQISIYLVSSMHLLQGWCD
jgi:hypothetical protein